MNSLTKQTYGTEHIHCMNKVLSIVGPTATGKTSLAVALGKQYNGELVSADSRQVYRYMDIGTGKDRESLQGIPLWMYDVVTPDEPFNVALFFKKARECIEDVLKRKKLPILVGGSGLYISSILHPLTVTVTPNALLREELSTYTKQELQQKLKHVGKKYWDALNPSDRENPRRLIRKIEIALGTNSKPSKKKELYDVLQIGLTGSMGVLYKHIDDRVDKRVTQGMVEEIRMLLQKGYTWDMPSMSGLGYRQWKPYIDGIKTKEEVIQKWKYDEHAYARRQMTWFRKDKTIHWFDIETEEVLKKIESLVRSWYTHG